MVLLDTQLTASEVLRTFHQDEPFLFLGSAFTTVGIVSALFCLVRRRLDPLLISMAAFAFLYGQRLWFQSALLTMLLPNTELFLRLRSIVDYLVPVPAFFFFQYAGLLGHSGKKLVLALGAAFLLLVVATSAFGAIPLFHTLNNVLIVFALLYMVIASLWRRSQSRDSAILRGGLVCFAAFALWDNTLGAIMRPARIEPYGFAIFLGSLGYVAARRMLERDQNLAEIQGELELARRIQFSLLPTAFPASTAFRVAARYVPMTSVAGDLYDYLVAGECQAGLLIADVSGHGVPAALIASMVKMAAISQRPNSAHPARLLAGMNAALSGNTQGQFATAAYVHLDATARELRYAAAGHPPMLMLRAWGGDRDCPKRPAAGRVRACPIH